MSDNLSQSPKPDISNTQTPQFSGPTSVPAANGANWVKDAFSYFMKYPAIWLVCTLITVIAMVILSVIPVIQVLANILAPVFLGGFMLGCQQIKLNKPFKVDHLFACFNQKFSPLAIVGLIYMACMFGIIVFTIALMPAFGVDLEYLQSLLKDVQNQVPVNIDVAELTQMILLPILIALALMIPVLMAYWFAPALVVLRDLSAVEAMKQSFAGCTKNVLPFLINGLVFMVIGIVCMVLLSIIGMISTTLLVPSTIIVYLGLASVAIASSFTAFSDIFPSPLETVEQSTDLEDPSNMIA